MLTSMDISATQYIDASDIMSALLFHGSKVFLDGVVDPLDEHAGQVGPLQQIGHRGAVPKRVYRPPAARSYTCDSRREARRSGLCLDKKGKGCMF